jgi:hypothetical protein
MKTLLALRGASNRGKSASLCMLIEMIRAAYPDATFDERRFKVDITLVATINGMKIGIETQGDPNSRLAKSLELFIKIKCKVIVCACRSYGQTVDMVRAAEASGYYVKWFEKAKIESPREYAAANKAVALELFEALRIALDA